MQSIMRDILKVLLLVIACALWACSEKDMVSGELGGDTEGEAGYREDPDASLDGYFEGEGAGGAGNGNENSQAGKITAGEWRDLDHWDFWSKLMTVPQADQSGVDYAAYCEYWGLYTNNRVAVRVTNNEGVAQRDVPVQLVTADSKNLYQGRTDNRGEVNLWIGLTQRQEQIDTASLKLIVNGVQQEAAVAVTGWGNEVRWNECKASVTATTDIDIAFIVDATGSMGDEIEFLKKDMTDIIGKASTLNASAQIRTAALFYRDEDGDEYVTRVNNFSSDLSATQAFIDAQSADGGGDFPEAVHIALETGLQQLSWREGNSIRLAFMLLDAPPHKKAPVLESLHQTIPMYAQRGIRIIPVAASGIDKPTEFFLRSTAIATDATYVFITNDSGIGGEHIQASVGDYEVELLNDLLVRLIKQYME